MSGGRGEGGSKKGFLVELVIGREWGIINKQITYEWIQMERVGGGARAAIAYFNFRAGSTFPVPVCTVPSSNDRTSRCNKVDAVRLYDS